MLAASVYVVLYNGTTLWHTIGLIEIVMTCYGGKSKFADVGGELVLVGVRFRC